MKVLRLLLTVLAVLIGFAGLLALVAVAPAVQTWAAQRRLAEHPELKGSLGSLSAGFGEVNIEDLHLETGGALLTLPSFQAKMSLTPLVLKRTAHIRSLVASGWTLDLSHSRDTAGLAGPQDAALVLGSLLRPWNLPVDLSLDDVEMEGDVLLPAPVGAPPAKMHLRITGGGMAGGREGSFTVETTGDMPGAAASTVSLHGTLSVAMDSPRTFSRLSLGGGVSGLGNPALGELKLTATAAIARKTGDETFGIEVERGGRRLVTLSTHLPTAKGTLSGTWTVNLGDADIAPFAADRTLPALSAQGSGTFDADTAFESFHVVGVLNGLAGRLGTIAPLLDRMGQVGLSAQFDLTRTDHALRVAALGIRVAGAQPLASVRALQAFSIDERTGALAPADPHADWLGVSIVGLPLSWLSGGPEGVAISGGNAHGNFAVRTDNGSFTMRPQGPFTAAGVALARGGKTLAQGLDVSATVEADFGPSGWRLGVSPLLVAADGGRVARLEAKATCGTGADQPIAVTGTWNADLAALASRTAMPRIGGYEAGTTSGDFAANVADTLDVQGKLLVVGSQAGHSIVASYHTDLDAGGVTFEVPLKITSGTSVSEFSADGTWVHGGDGDQIDLKLNGGSVALEHVLLLAAPMAAVGAGRIASAPGTRDTTPFWGDWTGHLTVAFEKLRLEKESLFGVGGIFNIESGSIRLEGGHGGPEHHNVTNIKGVLTFDAAAALPYALSATATGFELEAGALFKAPHTDGDAVVDGRFSVAPSLSGSGINLADLADRFRAEFRITSTVGIVRLFRADVASSLHEGAAPVKDTLGSVGSAVGAVFGIDKNPEFAAKNKLSKATDAALDLANQLAEIGCDQITVVAKRAANGAIEITSVDMEAPDTFIRGTGKIGNDAGVALFDQPLSLDLQLGAKGHVASLLATAGLVPATKDEKGFSLVSAPVHFGGSLSHIDGSDWQGRLVKAAAR